MNNDIFKTIETVEALKIALDLQHYENDTKTGTAQKRADKNVKSRVARIAKFKNLNSSNFEFIALRIVNLDEFERDIYAQDKVLQVCQYMNGNTKTFADISSSGVTRTVYGENCNGKLKANNAFLMLVDYINRLDCIENVSLTKRQIKHVLETYGQPSSSSSTQANSNFNTLVALNYATRKQNGSDLYLTLNASITELLSIFNYTHMRTLTELSRK